MKLSDLIDYGITLENSSINDIVTSLNERVHQIINNVNNNGNTPDIDVDIDNLKLSIDQLLSAITNVNYNLSNLRLKVRDLRTDAETDALIRSYEIYKMGKNRYYNSEYILERHNNRNMVDDDDVLNRYHQRVRLYSSWQHPGAIIRPLTGEILSSMVSNDPLYILDESDVLLEPSKRLFTPTYQSRICYKVFNEQSKPYLLNTLVPNQFGLIVMNEFLNVRPLEIIKEYLDEIYVLLKPGGMAMISFNNGDIPQSTRNFEAGALCYAPASLLIPLVNTTNFEIIKQVDTHINFSWLELKKPGKITSLKAGQTLAEIK